MVWKSEFQRLSLSCIWKAQKAFYDTNGVESWAVVPEYMSSNAFIAKQYAQLIISYIHDLHRNGSLDITQPLYLLELGAGTGKLAFLLFRHLTQLVSEIELFQKMKIYYILSDFSDSITSIWEQNGQFNSWISSGKADFVILDAEKWKAMQGIQLINSNTVLQSSGPNPLICIANYLFDSLQHDGFAVNTSGDLEEWKVQISSLFTPNDKAFLPSVIGTSDMKWKLDFIQEYDAGREQQEGPYLFDSDLNRILNWYQALNARETPEGMSFVLPVGAIRLIEELLKFSGNNLLMICGDKADCYSHEFDDYNIVPGITSHEGCFSFTTNFDSIGKLFELKNGFQFHATRESEFCVSSFVAVPYKAECDNMKLTCSQGEYKRITHQAKKLRNEYSALSTFCASVINFGPEHYFNIYKGARFINKQYKTIRNIGKNDLSLKREIAMEEYLEALIAQINLSNYDADFFLLLHKGIVNSIIKPRECKSLKKILFRVWGNDYFIPSISNDVAFAIAIIFQALEEQKSAIKFFKISAKRFPDEKFASLFNIGICYDILKQYEESLLYFRECLKLNPEDEDVLEKIKENETYLPEPITLAPPVPQHQPITRSFREETITAISAPAMMNRRAKYE